MRRAETFGWSRKTLLQTIFLGGGTPSVLRPADVEKILSTARDVFPLSKPREITLEANPESVTRDCARQWRSLGISRVSLGVQSLKDSELGILGRAHTAKTALNAFRVLRKAGFENLNVDLIFGIPEQSTQTWISTLSQILSWTPEHISAYSLTIEPGTSFERSVSKGNLHRLSDGLEAEMMERTYQTLSDAGYPPYEISNFAKPGFESQHNLTYWTGAQYWGVGVSAHSFQQKGDGFKRWWNGKNLSAYLAASGNNAPPPSGSEWVSRELHLRERLLTGLRLAQGVDLRQLQKEVEINLPSHTRDSLEEFIKSGHICRHNDRVFCTQRGVLVADEILLRLF